MKKLMIAAAIVCAAAMSHAAAMTWSAANIRDTAGDAAPACWLVQVYASTTEYSYDAAKAGSITADFSAPTVAVGTTGTVKAGESKVGTFSPGGSGAFYAVIYDAATVAGASHYIVSDNVSWSVNDQDRDFNVSFGNMTGTTSGNKFLNSEWQSVPEPTSGLLLLLGVAGLALRRRRA